MAFPTPQSGTGTPDDPFIYDICLGHEITSAIDTTIGALGLRPAGRQARFDFNGVTIQVAADSNPALIYRDWSRGMSGYHKDVVGPYPPAALSTEVLASDAEIEAANEARRVAVAADYQKKQDARAAAFATETAGSTFTFAGVEAMADWAKCRDANADPYGKAAVDFAEGWATLMEARMRGGASVADVADKASHDADIQGITGFMFGCAVSVLAGCWKHGEELRRWHNLKTQIRDEGEKANESGGVLNPAVLSIA